MRKTILQYEYCKSITRETSISTMIHLQLAPSIDYDTELKIIHQPISYYLLLQHSSQATLNNTITGM